MSSKCISLSRVSKSANMLLFSLIWSSCNAARSSAFLAIQGSKCKCFPFSFFQKHSPSRHASHCISIVSANCTRAVWLRTVLLDLVGPPFFGLVALIYLTLRRVRFVRNLFLPILKMVRLCICLTSASEMHITRDQVLTGLDSFAAHLQRPFIFMADPTVDTTISSPSVSLDGSVHEEGTSGLRDLLENLRLSGTFL